MNKGLPSKWQVVRLGDVCELNPRRPSLSRASDAPTSFVPMAAVAEDGKGIMKVEERPYAQVQHGYTYVADGDVLFAKITPCMQNGKHAIARGLIDGIGFGSTEFHVLRPSNGLTCDWLHSFLRQPWILDGAVAHFKGAVGQQRVPASYLSDLPLPLPPLPEQKRIAAILTEQMTAVERARVAAEEQLEAARVLLLAYLRQMFESDEARGWQMKFIFDITTTTSGLTPSRTRPDYFSGNIPWVKTGELRDSVVNDTVEHVSDTALAETSLRLLPAGTVLVAMYGQGQTRGRTARLGRPATTNQACFAMLPNDEVIDSEFLQWWFRYSYYRLRGRLGSR